jgi:GcrA cell cycle regulator
MTWWTHERITELKTRWDDGQTSTEIWQTMGATSRNAIIGKARRLGLPFRIVPGDQGVKGRHGKNRNKHGRKMSTLIQPQPVEDPPLISSKPKKIWRLHNADCRWPCAGEGTEMLFCAAPAIIGQPYCAAHYRIAFVPSRRS